MSLNCCKRQKNKTEDPSVLAAGINFMNGNTQCLVKLSKAEHSYNSPKGQALDKRWEKEEVNEEKSNVEI